MLGIGVFGWLLDVSGWNRHVLAPLRGFSGKRPGLPSLEQSVRAAAVSHGICFAIHVLLAVLALFTRHPWSAALWMLLPGVVVHLYPVLLQRSIMLRLQPLLDNTGSADWIGRWEPRVVQKSDFGKLPDKGHYRKASHEIQVEIASGYAVIQEQSTFWSAKLI
jgi:hypothetical protein